MFRVTRYPMISKTESGRVSEEIPGSGSGSGTRWALPPPLMENHPAQKPLAERGGTPPP